MSSTSSKAAGAPPHKERKRGSESPDVPDSSDFVSKSALDDLLAEMQPEMVTEISSKVTSTVKVAVEETVNRVVSTLLKKYDQTLQVTLSEHARQIQALEARANAKDTEMEALSKRLKELASRVEVAENADIPSVQVSALEDNREPIPNILRVNSRSQVPKTDIALEIEKHLTECKIDVAHYTVMGPTVGRYFSIKFKRGGFAVRDAHKFLSYIQNDGDWLTLEVKAPSGTVQFHVDEDKSPMQGRTELGGRRLRACLRSLCPDKHFTLRKKEAAVSSDGVPIVRCISDAPGQFRLEFNLSKCAEIDLDTQKLRDEFKQSFESSVEHITWSS